MLKPFQVSLLSDIETPVSLFYKLSRGSDTAFLFESSDGDRRTARFSILGIDPLLSLRYQDGQVTMTDSTGKESEREPCADLFERLQELQVAHGLCGPAHSQEELPFTAGWVGYLGYGMTRYFEGTPQQSHDPLGVPDAYMALYDTAVVFDHLYRRIRFISYRTEAEARQLWAQVQAAVDEHANGSVKNTLQPIYYQDDMSDASIFEGVANSVTREHFCQRVQEAQAYIREGQVFQIVLAQRFSLPVHGQPLDIYRVVQSLNPSPYAYYLQFPEFVYLGSSPETFVTVNGDNIVLRALAGTRPRGQTPMEDEAMMAELRASEKEMAEHRMLVDLARNDLGRVCQAGTVRVGELARLLKYSHVMHLSTEVFGRLQAGQNGFSALKSCFPRGTVSGAPKIRAMELLSRLESERRGIYAGFVGYFDQAGNADGAIAIRSVLIKDGVAHVHAGAGIVHDSTPEGEYEETRNKAKSILKAVRIAERISQYASPCC